MELRFLTSDFKMGDDSSGPKASVRYLEEKEEIRRESQGDGSEGKAQLTLLTLRTEGAAAGQ